MIRHGGDQTLTQTNSNGDEWRGKFKVYDGLLGLHCSYPTTQEMEALPIVWLTNDDEPWNPTKRIEKDVLMAPMY